MKYFFAILLILFTLLTNAQVKDSTAGSYTPGFFSTANFVQNPTCAVNTRNITIVGTGTVSKTTTLPLEGTASCLIGGTSIADGVKFSTKTFDYRLFGQTCEARFPYAGLGSKWSVSVIQGSTQVGQKINLTDNVYDSGSGAYLTREASITFPCGIASSGATTVQIVANAASPSSIRVGPVYVGIATNLFSASSGSEFGAKVAYGAVCAASPCTLTQNYGNTISSVTRASAGNYTINYTLNSIPSCTILPDNTNDIRTVRSGGQSTSGYSFITLNGSGTAIDSAFDIKCNKNGSDAPQTVLTQQNSNFGWTPYTPTYSGIGGITQSECFYRGLGSDAQVRCKFTSTSYAASEVQIGLPPNLTSADSTIIPSISALGMMMGTNNSVNMLNYAVLIEPSKTYFTVGVIQNSTTGSLLSKITNASGTWSTTQQFSFNVMVPIQGWSDRTNFPMFAGSISTNASDSGRVEIFNSAASDCTTGTCPSQGYKTPGITVSWNATGVYDVAFSPAFASAPFCTASTSSGTANNICKVSSTISATATQINCNAANTSTAINTRPTILCFGPR